MTLVSIYPHIKETKKSETMTISDVLDLIRTGAWSDQINNLRKAVAENQPEDVLGKIKAQLPYFTASGVFKERNDAGLIQHSGKLAIDFDKIPLEDRERVWDILVNDKYTEYAFQSCSARGFCIITNIDPTKHLDSFLYVQAHYKKCYGIHGSNEKDKSLQHKYLDEACKDVSRPRYVSSDEWLFHNPNYVRVDVPKGVIGGATMTVDEDDEKFEWVKSVVDKKYTFAPGSRHHYLIVLAFFLNKAGVSKDYMAMRYMSDYAPEMNDDKEVQRIIDSSYKNTAEHGTFKINKKVKDLPPEFAEHTKAVYKHAFGMNSDGRMWKEEDVNMMCSLHLLSVDIVRGIFKHVFEHNTEEFNINNKPEIAKVELFIKKRYEIVKNEVSQRIQARVKEKFEVINEHNIARDLMHAEFKFPLDKLRSLLESEFVPVFNPFRDYFESLPAWDEREEPDYISELADFITTDNQEFYKVQFKKALVRCLACTLDHIENRVIFTFVQDKQETGKSNFIRFLCPPALKDYYTETEMVAGEKDSDIQLSENMFWNLEELAALKNNEVNKLKAIISKAMVKQRRAYGRYHESNPRRVNFWASTNKREFLTDESNTRWLCFNVLDVNHDYGNYKTGVRKVNINNVWAQAMTLYKAGFNFTLDTEEKEERDRLNKDYELSSIEKDLLIAHFDVVDDPINGTFMTKTDMLITLMQITEYKMNHKIHEQGIDRAMKQLGHLQGFKKVNKKTVRGYYVKELTTAPGPKRNDTSIGDLPTNDEHDKTQLKKPF